MKQNDEFPFIVPTEGTISNLCMNGVPYEPVDRWVRVEDGLPEKDVSVLVYYTRKDWEGKHDIFMADYNSDFTDEEWTFADEAFIEEGVTVTHWQPLPAPPTVEGIFQGERPANIAVRPTQCLDLSPEALKRAMEYVHVEDKSGHGVERGECVTRPEELGLYMGLLQARQEKER